MTNKTILAITVGGLLTLSGCSSSPDSEMYDRIEEISKAQQELREQYEEREQERREDEIDILPDWVLEPPQSDATGMYAVGIAESQKLSHAMKSARLQAEFELAKVYKQELSGSERSFEQGDSEGNVTSQTTFLIDKIVDSVPIVGYQVVEQVVKPHRGIHNAFVLLKLPYDEFNKVLQQEKAKTLDKKVRENFDDLERRLDKRREQRMEEEQAKFEREQKALENRAEILSTQSGQEQLPEDGGM